MEGVALRDGLYGFEFRDVDQRRAAGDERKTYEAKAIWQSHHEMINLAVRGFKNVEIAEILNKDPQTVSNVLNSELGKAKIADLRYDRDEESKKVGAKIDELTRKALNVYHEIFDDESGEATLKDKKAVADTVTLELSGLRAPTKIQSSHVSTVLTKDEIEEFKNRGLEAISEVTAVEVKEVKNEKVDS